MAYATENGLVNLAIASGILAGAFFAFFTDITYEFRLILTSFFSFLGLMMGVYWGTPTDAVTLKEFIEKVNPIGFWPDRSIKQILKELYFNILKWFLICSGLILLLLGFHQLIFTGKFLFSFLFLFSGISLIYLAVSRITRPTGDLMSES